MVNVRSEQKTDVMHVILVKQHVYSMWPGMVSISRISVNSVGTLMYQNA